MKTTIIIGSGPAGLYAAIHASKENNRVIILEKNAKAGKKLFITGKGRCNLTNNCDEREFIQNIPNNGSFMYSSIYRYPPRSTIEFFESNGTPLVIERGNRVFPASYKAYDITDALVSECRRRGVRFSFGEEVKSISKEGDLFHIETNNRIYEADFVVIATGGLSYPSTGSTGDGYRFAKSFGHETIACVPALTGLRIDASIPPHLIGYTLKNVSLNVKNGKWKHSEFGELSFYGGYVDGPIAITTSSFINRMDPSSITMEIDLKPALSEEKLLSRINRDIEANPNSEVDELLRGLLPSSFLPLFLSGYEIDLKSRVNGFSKAKRMELCRRLKHFPLAYKGLNGFERAVVTSGGISTKEIQSNSMESKLIKNLFFAGEVIDVDAFTGGFNIQIALSTGAMAGDAIASRIE